MLGKVFGASKSKSFTMLIVTISLVGFCSLLALRNNNIASEFVVAGFAALFVILPTFFLMDQESESRLKSEKRSTLFKSNLEDYKKAATDMVGVLKDQKITLEELSLLRENHALLVILGSGKSISASHDFIEKCQKILQDSEDNKVDLNPENENALWSHVMSFLGAAREDLDDGKEKFGLENIAKDFKSLNETQLKIAMRVELPGKFDEWTALKKLNQEQKNTLKLFLGELIDKNQALEPKYTKSNISIRDTSHPREKVIFYLGSIKKNKDIRGTFAATNDKAFVNSTIDAFPNFLPKIIERHDGFGLEVTIPYQSSGANQIKEFQEAINKYRMHWKPGS